MASQVKVEMVPTPAQGTGPSVYPLAPDPTPDEFEAAAKKIAESSGIKPVHRDNPCRAKSERSQQCSIAHPKTKAETCAHLFEDYKECSKTLREFVMKARQEMEP
ncbi:hypothetical protein FVE85_0893 [Porphyridium purpureum]|uniref:Uncharacterized protein n=1 Tax=Porphyridium purpureum TaxID=35688 RepID=A0A5J4Z2K9_PORPP|nr:hypothetical protein FVE85_0893 [Porphyridium purpureum]|eukprot:POR2429..scf208_2